MTKPGKDPKQALADLAKSTAKTYNAPLPTVAQIFQKHPVTKQGIDEAIAEVEKWKRAEVIKALKAAGLY